MNKGLDCTALAT